MEKENFRRRSRYTLVFGVLAAAFCVVTVLNINTGNVHISIEEICKILIRRGGEGTEANIIWKIRLPRVLMAAILGGALSLSGFLLQTFFSNPIAGPFVLGITSVCFGNFFRGEDDGSAGNDIFPGEICFCIFLYVDHCCICGCTYFHWIYPVVVQKNDTYGNPSCGWNHDWIYLLGNY